MSAAFEFGVAIGQLSFEKQALVGATLGALAGAMTGRKGMRLKAVGRGAVRGLGTEIGAASGALMGLPFMGVGAIPGALAGGVLGNMAAHSAMGPYESDEEKFLRALDMHKKVQERASDIANPKKKNKDNEKKALDLNAAVPSALLGAGIGGLGGLALGGKKRRLRAMLAGLAAGGLAGGGASVGGQVGANLGANLGAKLTPSRGNGRFAHLMRKGQNALQGAQAAGPLGALAGGGLGLALARRLNAAVGGAVHGDDE